MVLFKCLCFYGGFRDVILARESRNLLHLFFRLVKMDSGMKWFSSDYKYILVCNSTVLFKFFLTCSLFQFAAHYYQVWFWREQVPVSEYLPKLNLFSGVPRLSSNFAQDTPALECVWVIFFFWCPIFYFGFVVHAEAFLSKWRAGSVIIFISWLGNCQVPNLQLHNHRINLLR